MSVGQPFNSAFVFLDHDPSQTADGYVGRRGCGQDELQPPRPRFPNVVDDFVVSREHVRLQVDERVGPGRQTRPCPIHSERGPVWPGFVAIGSRGPTDKSDCVRRPLAVGAFGRLPFCSSFPFCPLPTTRQPSHSSYKVK